VDLVTEKALIIQSINGDLAAFDQLMQLHQSAVFITVNRFIPDKQNALDICQNVFIKAWQNLKKFKAKSSFKTWLWRIAVNESLTWVRLNQKQQRFTPIHAEKSVKITDREPNPEENFLKKEQIRLIHVAISRLNSRYREAIILRYIEGKPIREIAGALNCSDGVVKSMLFRSIRQLQTILKELN